MALYQTTFPGHFRHCRDQEISLVQEGCPRCQKRAYLWAFGLSLLAAGIELLGSHYSSSLALYGDSIHVFVDGLGYLLAFLMIYLARTRRTEFPFLIGVGVLLVWSAYHIIAQSLERAFRQPVPIRQIDVLLWAATFGLIVNALVIRLLHQVRAPVHGHAHAHSKKLHTSRRAMLNANIVHTIGDFASSVLVIGSGTLLVLEPNAQWVYILDPAIAALIALMLIWQAIKLWRTIRL